MSEESAANSLPTADMVVAEILARWPETAQVFQKFKTACVGCTMAPFDTVADVARIYELNGDRFLNALRRVASGAADEQTTMNSEEI